MALAKKLADKLIFLHEGRVVFYGTPKEMEHSKEEIVQEFLELDSSDFSSFGKIDMRRGQPGELR
jgi:phospholipid/cholesterol/gamma-HCH transport system ATP-binding protein